MEGCWSFDRAIDLINKITNFRISRISVNIYSFLLHTEHLEKLKGIASSYIEVEKDINNDWVEDIDGNRYTVVGIG